MIIVGAGRHAIEIYDILEEENEVCFFDDIKKDSKDFFMGEFRILKSVNQAVEKLKEDKRFILGLAGVKNRRILSSKFKSLGGELTTIIAKEASIGKSSVELSEGLNIMKNVMISSCTEIGEGTLINAFCSIHHDVSIGSYCEIAPNATILGGVIIGDNCFIGASSTILPNIVIGDDVIVGAGSVVTKNLSSKSIVIGIPAKPFNKK